MKGHKKENYEKIGVKKEEEKTKKRENGPNSPHYEIKEGQNDEKKKGEIRKNKREKKEG